MHVCHYSKCTRGLGSSWTALGPTKSAAGGTQLAALSTMVSMHFLSAGTLVWNVMETTQKNEVIVYLLCSINYEIKKYLIFKVFIWLAYVHSWWAVYLGMLVKLLMQRRYYTCMCMHMLAPKTHNTHIVSLIHSPVLQRKFCGRKVCLLIFSEWALCPTKGWKVVAIKFFCWCKFESLDDSHLRWFCERGCTEVSLYRLCRDLTAVK
jgi:hypothetical protein